MAESKINFTIAGMSTRIIQRNVPPEIEEFLYQTYSDFIAPRVDNELLVIVQTENGDPFIPFTPGTWQIRTNVINDIVEFESHLESGWFDLAFKQGELVIRPGGNPENYLRVLYAWRCLDQGALLLHASGMIRNDRGFVFFGPSGSGKTTTILLSENVTVLSDDLVILKYSDISEGNYVQVFGVPFRGEMPEAPRTNANAELAGIFALSKDKDHFLVDIDPGQVLGRLVSCVPFVLTQPKNANRVISLCAEITRRVPVQELHFRRDPGFWSIIDG